MESRGHTGNYTGRVYTRAREEPVAESLTLTMTVGSRLQNAVRIMMM